VEVLDRREPASALIDPLAEAVKMARLPTACPALLPPSPGEAAMAGKTRRALLLPSGTKVLYFTESFSLPSCG